MTKATKASMLGYAVCQLELKLTTSLASFELIGTTSVYDATESVSEKQGTIS